MKKLLLIGVLLFGKSLWADPHVVCVHGFMRGAGNMSAMARTLRKSGVEVVNWTYPSRQKRIEEHAADLVQQLQELADGEPIHFVTHSMGGLVVRCALNHPECPEEAKRGRAVLIAPPNRGSILARKLGSSRMVRALLGREAGHQLMTTPEDGFDAWGCFPWNMPVLVISGTAGFNPLIPGPNDGKVGDSETCLPTPHFHLRCKAGHSWICHSRKVIHATERFLQICIPNAKLHAPSHLIQ